MSYIKKCNVCNEEISMRQMPDGQWVAFDYKTDTPHSHTKSKTKKKKHPTSKRTKSRRTIKKKQSTHKDHIVTRYGQIIDPYYIPNEWLSLTPKNLAQLLPYIINNKNMLRIQYSGLDGETERTIYPTSLTTENAVSTKKLHAYCALREERRLFRLAGIKKIKLNGTYTTIPKPVITPTTKHGTTTTTQRTKTDNSWGWVIWVAIILITIFILRK